MHYVIFTGGILVKGHAVQKVLAHFDRIIAVDSGASHCYKFKLDPDYIVGDLDSIDKNSLKKFEKLGSKIVRFPEEKDFTDTELGIDLAIKNDATQISILGGIAGDRFDHILSNVLLLLKKKFAKAQIKFANGNQEIYVARNEVKISGKKGDTISFIPISGSVMNITSTGLKYDLANYQLSIQGNHGISNVLTNTTAAATFKNKSLLIIHTLLA
ncbi:MAG TPA: thiamine diphosphokinase [Candidatus Limnocylindrales bacterium]|nr:thiamine diphosphokinase [Candidatus Limnocylindrales bacterium]